MLPNTCSPKTEVLLMLASKSIFWVTNLGVALTVKSDILYKPYSNTEKGNITKPPLSFRSLGSNHQVQN